MTAAGTDSTKIAACDTVAKAAYAASMGLEASAVSPATMQMVKTRAAEKAMTKAMDACMESASGAAAMGRCKQNTAKAAMKKALGKAEVSTVVHCSSGPGAYALLSSAMMMVCAYFWIFLLAWINSNGLWSPVGGVFGPYRRTRICVHACVVWGGGGLGERHRRHEIPPRRRQETNCLRDDVVHDLRD
jgi:hypothetical protein